MPGSYGYTGQRADSTTGLDYYNARYYDPLIGQFTSADTVADGLNRYGYAYGNPTTLTDPTGHCPWCLGAIIGAVAGAAISYGTQVAENLSRGESWDKAMTNVDGGKILLSAVAGGLIGLTGGLASAALGPMLGGATMAVRVGGMIVGEALIGAGEGSASQVAFNVIHGRRWDEGVAEAAVMGAVNGGVAGGFRAASQARRAIASGAGKAERQAVGEAAGEARLACKLSFAAETAVATPKGERAIGSLAVGDHVVAYDDATGASSVQTVEHVWVNHDDNLLDVTLRQDDQPRAEAQVATRPTAQQVATTAHGSQAPPSQDETVQTTDNHPWLTAERGWVVAGALHLGERVVRLDGTMAVVTALQMRPGAADYYNLTVSQVHTFAVGSGRYVVHNCGGALPALGAYGEVGGHHIYAQSAFKGAEGYSSRAALAISDESLEALGAAHRGVGSVTTYQRSLYDDLARRVRTGEAQNTLRAHTQVAWRAMHAAGVNEATARWITAQALRNLRNMKVHAPQHIPWMR